MTELLRNWLYALAGASIVCALATALTPEGRWRRITQLVCWLVMVVALISPLRAFDVGGYGEELSKYQTAAAEAAGKSEDIDSSLNRTIIEEQCQAYILDKAKSAGADMDAAVTARWSTEGFWYPYEVKMTGSCGEKAKSELAGLMESELGIPEERQYWSDTDE